MSDNIDAKKEKAINITLDMLPATAEAVPHLAENGVAWYSFPALSAFDDRLYHGFSTRIGGVSSGGQAWLNLGNPAYDEEKNIRENFSRLAQAAGFDPASVVVSHQTHKTMLLTAGAEHKGMGLFCPRNFEEKDGLITAEQGITLVTTYADCGPLLFYAPDKHMAATSHAGWRGTAAGMAGITARRMAQLGCDMSALVCVIGPCAGPELYEVDEPCAAHFKELFDEQGSVLSPQKQAGKYLLDIARANRCFLLDAGMKAENIHIAGLCTIANSNIFYSQRAAGSKANRGSLAAFIGLK